MNVLKRKGHTQKVDFNKIQLRLETLSEEPYKLKDVNIAELSKKVIQGLYDRISTQEIDNFSANICASEALNHPDYGKLASRIVINNHHKNTLNGFRDKVNTLYMNTLVNDRFYKFVDKHAARLEHEIDYDRDYLIDFFGFKTLEKAYLKRVHKGDITQIIERPQDMFMRVAISIHMPDLDKAIETYHLMSNKKFIHATPTLFNAGTLREQYSSCFLLGTHDSLKGIMKLASDCAEISKWGGGIGFHFSNWRGNGALIRGTNGKSNGIVPFLKLMNSTARAFNQGGKRLGSFAAYIEPHHPDILNFLDLRKNYGDENARARDLFYGLWISDLFMKRVEADGDWCLFDPDECPGLNDSHSTEYETLYLRYEKEGREKDKFKARKLWHKLWQTQKETGLPYMLYKDSCNRNSNQQNLGTIKSSNLCCEIIEYSDDKEYANCNLASICLPQFVKDKAVPPNHEFPKEPYFDYKELANITRVITRNLNNIIDKNYYPVPETKLSNFRHRPIGIGVQGLVDVYLKFRLPFESEGAKEINKKIFESIYFGALTESTMMAKERYKSYRKEWKEKGEAKVIVGYKNKNKKIIPTYKVYTTAPPKESGAYTSFKGSPLSSGYFHFETWNKDLKKPISVSKLWDWETLRNHILTFGVVNSLCIACMPTASTSQIMGNTEGIDPITANIYRRKTLAGEFIIINKYLIRDLITMGIWNSKTRDYLKVNNGSIQNIDNIPQYIKNLYKTVWEIKQRTVIDQAADRGAFIDQSQSMNIFIDNLTYKKFNSVHFYGWKKGLKTGSYYMRTQTKVKAQKFTVNPKTEISMKTVKVEDSFEDGCLLCGS